MNTSERERNLNTFVLLLVIYLALQSKLIFPDLEHQPIVQAVIVLSSKGLYELIIRSIYWIANTSGVLLRLYWGPLYLRGCWSYKYTLKGKVHFGVWEFDQDIHGVQVIGSGLDDDFRVRTIVRSVSPLIAEQGGYFILNSRNELANDNARVFSKTTLLLDKPRRPWGLVRSMRATTEIYGGPSDRQLHPDVVFTRHPEVENVDKLIDLLRQERAGESRPTSDNGGAMPAVGGRDRADRP